MKESISYSFLLNIIILFIFVCVAIIMGIFSYYKAFRANTIISETIEKYEGFNCVSKEEIARKLGGLGYNTPFNVQCKSSDGNCETDSDTNGNYKVISYNLDFEGNHVYNEDMNSTYKCEEKNGINYCTTNKHYQYGIYTYMYVELPVVSSLLKLSYFSKTNPMYEFRNFYVEQTSSTSRSGETTTKTLTTDVESIFDNLYKKEYIDGKLYVKDQYKNSSVNSFNASNSQNQDGTVDFTFEQSESPSTETATQILATASLKLFGIQSGKPLEKFNEYAFFTSFLTGKNTITNRNLAMLNKMGIETNSGTLYTYIMTRGLPRNPNPPGNECGYVMDYGLLN